MKRLSLPLVAIVILLTASGCCCGLGHCGGNCCGYPPAYPVSPGCSSCPTCPSGGCGVQGPMIQQGAFYDGASLPLHASNTPANGASTIPTLAAADTLSTY